MIVFYSGLFIEYLRVQLYDRITSYLIVQVFPTASLYEFQTWFPVCLMENFSPWRPFWRLLSWPHLLFSFRLNTYVSSVNLIPLLSNCSLTKFEIGLAFIKCLICDQHWAGCRGYRWVSYASSSRRAHQSGNGRPQRPWMEKDKSGAGRLSQGSSQIGKILCAEFN